MQLYMGKYAGKNMLSQAGHVKLFECKSCYLGGFIST